MTLIQFYQVWETKAHDRKKTFFRRSHFCQKCSWTISHSVDLPRWRGIASGEGVHKRFANAGRITLIFVNYGRLWVQHIFIWFHCFCFASTRLFGCLCTKYLRTVNKEFLSMHCRRNLCSGLHMHGPEPCESLLVPPQKKFRWGPLTSASIEADACFFDPIAN